jgi:hypothetical protein
MVRTSSGEGRESCEGAAGEVEPAAVTHMPERRGQSHQDERDVPVPAEVVV